MKTLHSQILNAVSKIVADFQTYRERFWNERDVHWSLFYRLQQMKVAKEDYPTQLIRAEFPTHKIFPGERPARGHYDLVIINYESYNKPEVQGMKTQAPWDKYLGLIKLDVAIEIKLWQARLREEAVKELIDWDIQKLTDEARNVKNAYFLNFVQLDFESQYMRQYYRELREYLITKKRPGLNILCVPSEPQVQPDPKDNWL